jgi:predicted TIM-barrel fold metal-dependent hydrolase
VAGAVVISANDHVLEPPHLWLDHLPARYRDRAPHVVDQPDGGQAWIFGDQVVPVSRLAACAGEDPDTFRMGAPARYDDLRKGVYDPLARVADMDQDGVERHACLPSMIGFGGTRLLQFDDRDLALACIRAYNDFIIDEWCGAAPERFISVALLPQWDVAVAAGEAERVVGKGVHAVAFVEDPTSLGFPSWHGRYWNPALAVVHEAGIPLCLHMQTVPIRMVPGPDTPFGVDLTLMYCTSMATMVNLLFSPVFLDFPELKVILAEGGLGWIPFMLEKADFLWDRHRMYARNPLIERPVLPSELYKGHIYGTIQSHDDAGIRERHTIGIGQILWQCDYPHADSAFPESADILGAQLRDIPAVERVAILGGNARRVFRLGD